MRLAATAVALGLLCLIGAACGAEPAAPPAAPAPATPSSASAAAPTAAASPAPALVGSPPPNEVGVLDDGCNVGQRPNFDYGFAALRGAIGDRMGDPASCERYGPEGDALQQTTTGLARYRKASNTPTFTSGSEHWAMTDRGLVHWTGSALDPPPDAAPVPTGPVPVG